MKIVYDDLAEFVEVRQRCHETRKSNRCRYCPFYDRCDVGDVENLHTMCCEILSMKEGEQKLPAKIVCIMKCAKRETDKRNFTVLMLIVIMLRNYANISNQNPAMLSCLARWGRKFGSYNLLIGKILNGKLLKVKYR